MTPLADLRLDGTDLLPYLRGDKKGTPHEVLFWRIHGGPSHAVRCGNLKLGKFGKLPPALFDLENDPGETKSLADSQPQKLEELSTKYNAWNQQLIAPLWEPVN